MYLGKTDVFTFEMEDIAILRVCLGLPLCFLSFLCNTQTSWICPGHGVRADCLREPHCVQDHDSSQGTHFSLSFGYNFIWAKMVFPSNKNV